MTKLILIMLVIFLTNAVAKAAELERGDINSAARSAAMEQAEAAKAMQLAALNSQDETLIAELE